VAEGARLESVFTRKGNVGSNPTLSASLLLQVVFDYQSGRVNIAPLQSHREMNAIVDVLVAGSVFTPS
jgi:hypothetical protein